MVLISHIASESGCLEVSSLLGASFGTGNQDEFKVILTVGLPALLSPGFLLLFVWDQDSQRLPL